MTAEEKALALIHKMLDENVFVEHETDPEMCEFSDAFLLEFEKAVHFFFDKVDHAGRTWEDCMNGIIMIAYMNHRDIPMLGEEINQGAKIIKSYIQAVQDDRLNAWVNWIKVRAAQ